MARRLTPETTLALAVVLIGLALHQSNGFYTAPALWLLVCATALSVAALIRPAARRASPEDEPAAGVTPWRRLAALGGFQRVALAGLLLEIFLLGQAWPGLYAPAVLPQDHLVLLGALGTAALAVALIAWDEEHARTLWFPLALVAAATMGVWMIHTSPNPKVDVLTVHHHAIAALMDGQNPYAITFPNIYRDVRYYGPGMSTVNTVLFGFPYPPLSLLMVMPGQLLLGDVRFAQLAALLTGATLIALAPRARGAGRSVAPLAAALLLFAPRWLFVLEQGWTEPLAICWLGGTIFAACRAPRALPWALALLVAVKQHMVLAMPLGLLLLPRGFDRRAAVALLWPSALLPAALVLPFLIWGAQAFLRSAVMLQFYEPFRVESLSLLSAAAVNGFPVEQHRLLLLLLPLAALALASLATWRWAERSPAGFSLGLGLCLLAVFLVSKKAFANYYYFVVSAFCAAAAAYSHHPESEAAPLSGERSEAALSE